MRVSAVSALRGSVKLGGDKSIAHRALMLGALAHGTTRIANLPASDDLASTLRCLEALGVPIERNGGGALHVRGGTFHESRAPLDCGGSGTTMRLMAGLLAAQPFTSILSANAQLSRRPMQRVIEPLTQMGADISALDRTNSHAPDPARRYTTMVIRGGGLRAIDYAMPVASAQVKSAILLAALGAEGETKVREGAPTRDHTERMLKAMGANITSTHSAPDARSDGEARVVSLTAGPLAPIAISVPGDFSSAAFFIVAAWLARDADVRIEAVGLNPTRTGLLDIARMMGASATVEALREEHDEPVGDLLVRPAAGLCGVVIDGDLVPRAIDEFPLVALLATQADGETVVRGAQELRVKESDRVASVVLELRKMGAQIEERADGFVVNGPTRLCGARVDSHGDHRLAMMLAVAGLIADGETLIDGSACISKSFPDFERTLAALVSR